MVGEGDRAPNDHMNIRILHTMSSGIPPILGLGTRMSDPYVYVPLGEATSKARREEVHEAEGSRQSAGITCAAEVERDRKLMRVYACYVCMSEDAHIHI